MKIGVIGDLSIDTTIKVSELPTDKNRHVYSERSAQDFGGIGAMQAIAMARLGLEVAICGKLGNDLTGVSIVNNLKENNVNTVRLIRDEKVSSGMNVVLINQDNKTSLISSPGANFSFTSEDFEDVENFIEIQDVVVFQLGINYPFVSEMIKYAKELGKIVILNTVPGHFIEEDVLECIDVVITNTSQLATALGVKTPINNVEQAKIAAKKLNEIGVEKVIVTLAEHGCLYSTEKQQIESTPYNVEKVKRAGANDAFVAAIVKMIVNKEEVKKGLDLANKAAAYALTIDSYQESLPTLAQLNMSKISK